MPPAERYRRAARLGWAAVGLYAAVVLLAASALVWPTAGWLAIGAAVLGFACQRAASALRGRP